MRIAPIGRICWFARGYTVTDAESGGGASFFGKMQFPHNADSIDCEGEWLYSHSFSYTLPGEGSLSYYLLVIPSFIRC